MTSKKTTRDSVERQYSLKTERSKLDSRKRLVFMNLNTLARPGETENDLATYQGYGRQITGKGQIK